LKENQIEESEKLTNQRRLLMLKKKSIKKWTNLEPKKDLIKCWE
jgi:hypothetical protein